MSVFIASKVKNAEPWLTRFLLQLDKLEGNISRIALMYGESPDNSFAILDHWRKNVTKHNVEVYADPYMPHNERTGATLARIKKDIQKLLATGGEQYYLNLDCDLIKLPTDLIPQLMKRDKDIIAPMNWTEGRKPKTFFDVYEFRQEGCMFHPWNPPGYRKTEPFPVDSVSTCYLATSEAELAGKYSNPYPHIPFCKSLKDQGFQVWVDPLCHCTHVDLERYGIQHILLPIKLSAVHYIDDDSYKYAQEQVAAQRHHLDSMLYDLFLAESNPLEAKMLQDFKDSRQLLTASLKVYNDAEYLPYCLKALYPHVDCIDIMYGVVEKNLHSVKHVDSTLEVIIQFPDPDKKIRLIQHRKWKDKQEIQAKLLEICRTKWMLYIDSDEIIGKAEMEMVQDFCATHQDGSIIHARPHAWLHFFHDWRHFAYSLNPFSAWFKDGQPHPFLIWRDIPGLNFARFHTLPLDGLGIPIHVDHKKYQKQQATLDDVTVFHFGSAKSPERMEDKLRFEHKRQHGDAAFKTDKEFWFANEMPSDFIIEEYNGKYPRVLRDHPMRYRNRIKITETKPVFKFERIKRK